MTLSNSPLLAPVVWALLGLAATAGAQNVVIPSQPGKFRVRGAGTGADSGVSVNNPVNPEPRTVVIQYTAVTPEREWTNTDGKKMIARLLAFSTPKEGESTPVEVIREGRVRFLMNLKREPIDYELANLGAEDQVYVKALAQAARTAAQAAAEETAAEAEAKKSGEKAE